MADFGFAKKIGNERTFTICGTPDYQVRGTVCVCLGAFVDRAIKPRVCGAHTPSHAYACRCQLLCQCGEDPVRSVGVTLTPLLLTALPAETNAVLWL
jgi:hypothetical protein